MLQHNMVYGNFKDLSRRTGLDKVLRDEAFNFAKNPIYIIYKYMIYKYMIYKYMEQELILT